MTINKDLAKQRGISKEYQAAILLCSLTLLGIINESWLVFLILLGLFCCLILAEWGQSQGWCSPSPEEIDANLDYINPPETAKWYVKGDGRVYTTAASILNSKAGRRHMENVRKIKLDNENDKE